MQSLERDLQEAKVAAREGKLKPLPGETVSHGDVHEYGCGERLHGERGGSARVVTDSDWTVPQMEKCAQDLGNSTKAVSSAIAQLLGEVAQGNENYTGTWILFTVLPAPRTLPSGWKSFCFCKGEPLPALAWREDQPSPDLPFLSHLLLHCGSPCACQAPEEGGAGSSPSHQVSVVLPFLLSR